MRAHPAALFLALVALTAPHLSADSWKLADGRVIEGTVHGLHGDYVLITDRTRFGLFEIAGLADDEIPRLADYLIAHPKPAAAQWSQSDSRVIKELRGRLQILADGAVQAFEPGDRAEPEYFLVYFSAHWCGPCRRFTPRLVERYHALKRAVPDRFELIFISNDRSAGDQEKYVREAGMPWPFVRYRSVGSIRSLEQWEGNGIPCLVLVDRDANLIFHSYNGETYLGPEDVLVKFEALLASSPDEATPRHENVHRLAVHMHVRSKPADGPPQPYRVGLDHELFPTLLGKSLEIRLEIDADGRVVSVEPGEQMSDITAMRFVAAAKTWQFLPAIRDGAPVPARIVLPVRLGSSS